jgi:hypothetical protein
MFMFCSSRRFMSPVQSDTVLGELTSSKTILTSLLRVVKTRRFSRAIEACPADVLQGSFVFLRQDALTFVHLVRSHQN